MRDKSGYPMKGGNWYYIGGGQDNNFKAKAIEFYGVKVLTWWCYLINFPYRHSVSS